MAKAKICSVAGCGNTKRITKGMCSKHYQRYRRHGDANFTKIRTTERGSVQSFIENVALPYAGDDCLFWPFTTAQGRGFARYKGKWGIVTRHICSERHGPPPSDAHEAAHSCGNGNLGCVNPNHLRWATHRENEQDKVLHGTSQHGMRNAQAKLTENDVREIRTMCLSLSQSQVAKKFGITQPAVSAIVLRRNWAWLD